MCLRLREDGLHHRVPACEFPRERGRIAGSRPGFARLFLGRDETDVVDEFVGAHRETRGNACRRRASCASRRPASPRWLRKRCPRCATVPKTADEDGATTNCCSVEWMPSAPITTSAVVRLPLANVRVASSVVLLETDASVPGVHDAGRQPVDEHGQQVGAVHAVELDLAGELRWPHRRGEGAVRRSGTAGRPTARR